MTIRLYCLVGDIGCIKAQWEFLWKEAGAGAKPSFRIYWAWTGQSGGTCSSVFAKRTLIVKTAVGATSAKYAADASDLSIPGGTMCSWIQAVSSSGSSNLVAFPTSQWP